MFNFLKKKFKTPEELDNLYEIIDDHNSWVEIRKKGDTSYWNDDKSFFVYKFTDGIRKFCLEQKIHLCFTPWDKVFYDFKSIYHYMKDVGCCDLILDILIGSRKIAEKSSKIHKLPNF